MNWDYLIKQNDPILRHLKLNFRCPEIIRKSPPELATTLKPPICKMRLRFNWLYNSPFILI